MQRTDFPFFPELLLALLSLLPDSFAYYNLLIDLLLLVNAVLTGSAVNEQE